MHGLNRNVRSNLLHLARSRATRRQQSLCSSGFSIGAAAPYKKTARYWLRLLHLGRSRSTRRLSSFYISIRAAAAVREGISTGAPLLSPSGPRPQYENTRDLPTSPSGPQPQYEKAAILSPFWLLHLGYSRSTRRRKSCRSAVSIWATAPAKNWCPSEATRFAYTICVNMHNPFLK